MSDILITKGLIFVYSRSAKPLCAGSIPARASKSFIGNRLGLFPAQMGAQSLGLGGPKADS
jgi:hypothetical protein